MEFEGTVLSESVKKKKKKTLHDLTHMWNSEKAKLMVFPGAVGVGKMGRC